MATGREDKSELVEVHQDGFSTLLSFPERCLQNAEKRCIFLAASSLELAFALDKSQLAHLDHK
jgi:hypothetical protein